MMDCTLIIKSSQTCNPAVMVYANELRKSMAHALFVVLQRL